MGEPLEERGEGVASRVADRTRETLGRAKDGLKAGASGVAEVTRTVAGETRERAGRVAEFVSEAEPDEELKATVSTQTATSLDRAGDALIGAAPAIGRGAERAAEKVGQALHAAARPLAVVLGAIAGTLGGWWNKAAENRLELPKTEDEACRAHFATIAVLPAGMTYDRARTGYALGYVASRNPDYQGRLFEDVEPDLRHGFGDVHASDYDSLREFTRFGYERGMTAS